MRNWKRVLAAGLAAMLAMSAVVSAHPNETAADAAQTTGADVAGSFREWETDIHMAIRNERQLVEEAGMTLDEWDAAVEEKKQEGLESALIAQVLLAADPELEILEEDGKVYYIGASSAIAPIESDLDAYRAVYSLAELLGGDEDIDLRLWSKLMTNGTTVYNFQQVAASEMVKGSTIKIAVDDDGCVTAVFGGLCPEEAKEGKPLVTRQEAEEAALAWLEKNEGVRAQLCEGVTERIARNPEDIPTALNLDVQQDDAIPYDLYWVVYTLNEDKDTASEYPFVAAYVTLDGECRFTLPVKEPGSNEARTGYRTKKVFEGMTAGEWTGEIRALDGTTMTVTLPVMYSEETGKWYLGDVERRIAVADFAALVYGDDHAMELVSTEDNEGWDNEDLFMLYNYIRAWDFYADMGWIGPDGQGTDVVILKGLCTSDGTPYENACSIGLCENWQMFGYTSYGSDGKPLGLVQGLDVMAHEYTHTFTGTLMNQNLYQNDLGAINEAMSDIMGNLIEFMLTGQEDPYWLLGEHTGNTIRSMTNPQMYNQPAYVWDLHYGPHTDNPGDNNDHGGVHSNSSLLNHIAAVLCQENGMSYEEAVALWTMVAFGMTSRTDYVQIPALLKWALTMSWNGVYEEPMEEVVAEEQLSLTTYPEMIPEDYNLVKLVLPEEGVFAEDDQWVMFAFQADLSVIRILGEGVLGLVMQLIESGGDTASLSNVLAQVADRLYLDKTELKLEDVSDINGLKDASVELLLGAVKRLVSQYIGWTEGDSNEMVVMTKTGPTLYAMMNISKSGTQLNALAVLVGDEWIDVGAWVAEGQDKTEGLLQQSGLPDMDLSQLLTSLTGGEEAVTEGEGASQAEAVAAEETADAQTEGETSAQEPAGEEEGSLSDAIVDLAKDLVGQFLSKDEVKTEIAETEIAVVPSEQMSETVGLEEAGEAPAEEEQKSSLLLDLVSGGMELVGHLLGDEEAEADENGGYKVTEPVYLSNKGLEKLQFADFNALAAVINPEAASATEAQTEVQTEAVTEELLQAA